MVGCNTWVPGASRTGGINNVSVDIWSLHLMGWILTQHCCVKGSRHHVRLFSYGIIRCYNVVRSQLGTDTPQSIKHLVIYQLNMSYDLVGSSEGRVTK